MLINLWPALLFTLETSKYPQGNTRQGKQRSETFLLTTLWGRHYYAHLTVKQTEAQGYGGKEWQAWSQALVRTQVGCEYGFQGPKPLLKGTTLKCPHWSTNHKSSAPNSEKGHSSRKYHRRYEWGAPLQAGGPRQHPGRLLPFIQVPWEFLTASLRCRGEGILKTLKTPGSTWLSSPPSKASLYCPTNQQVFDEAQHGTGHTQKA